MTKKSINDAIPTGTWRLLPSLKPVPVVLDSIRNSFYITDKGQYIHPKDVYLSRDAALKGAQENINALRCDIDRREADLAKKVANLAKFKAMPA